MTEKTKPNIASSTPDASQDLPQSKPKLILPLGRGSRGKSLWARWMIDRAQSQGREIIVADADRTNPALAQYFDGVLVPPSAEADDMEEWLSNFFEQQFEGHFNAIVDLGGGDQLLKTLARRVELVSYLKRNGIEPVAVHLLSPSLEDLAFLRDLEADGLFAPEATLLVLNEGHVMGKKSSLTAFQHLLDHPIFKAAVKRGAKLAWMPRLDPILDIEIRHLTMTAAEAGRSSAGLPPIRLWKRELITMWLRDMEQNFAPFASWLA
jgi:hypothetical protein